MRRSRTISVIELRPTPWSRTAWIGRSSLIAGLMLLAACSSSPSRFYVLTVVPPTQRTAPMPGSGGTTVAIGAVNFPNTLAKPQMARRLGSNELVFDETQRWGESLDGMSRRILGADIAQRLPAGMVMVDAEYSTPAAVTVTVDFLRFEADEAGNVTLSARWQALDRAGAPFRTPREVALDLPSSGKDAPAMATTMSLALGALADQITAGLGGGR